MHRRHQAASEDGPYNESVEGFLQPRYQTPTVLTLITIVVATFLAFYVWDLFMVAWVHRQTFGRYDVSMRSKRMLDFTSSTGRFSLRHDLQVLRYEGLERSGEMPYGDIDAIELNIHSDSAWSQELFLGMDIGDLFRRYRDSVEWHTITVISRRGDRIPMFRSGKYRQRKFLYALHIEIQLVILESTGLLVNVERQSRRALEEIRNGLDQPKLIQRRFVDEV